MDPLATIRRRHASQRLAGEPLGSVVDAVRWSGAVQAQEFAEVKWSLAERIAGVEARITAEDGHLTLYERRLREVNEWLLSHS